jgi:hypothetical protein
MALPHPYSQTLPNGSAWAAILAAGIGCATLGLIVDLAEASKFVSKALNFYSPSGDLSGKTTLAILVWLIAWVALHARWKRRDIQSTGMVMMISLILILLGLIAAYPPLFGMFAAE